MAEDTKITIFDNGPIEVVGHCTVQNAAGETEMVADRIYLCRCGMSKNKPFCDGSHKKGHFSDDGNPGFSDK